MEALPIKKLLIGIVIIVVAIPIVAVVSWQLYTIHDSVYEGSAYGFSIGASKRETYSAISRTDVHSIWLIYPERTSPGIEILKGHEITFDKLEKVNQWELTFGSESLLNSIRLVFQDNELVNIYRHRQAVELP